MLSHRKKTLCSQGKSWAAKIHRLRSAGPEPRWHNLSSLGWFSSTLHKVRLWIKKSFEVAGDSDHPSVLGYNELIRKFPEFKKSPTHCSPLFRDFSWTEERITGAWSTRSYGEVVVYHMTAGDSQEGSTINSKSRRDRLNPTSCHRRN